MRRSASRSASWRIRSASALTRLSFLLLDYAYALQSFVSGSARLFALILKAVFKFAAFVARRVSHTRRLIEVPSDPLAPLLHGLSERLIEEPVHDVDE